MTFNIRKAKLYNIYIKLGEQMFEELHLIKKKTKKQISCIKNRLYKKGDATNFNLFWKEHGAAERVWRHINVCAKCK